LPVFTFFNNQDLSFLVHNIPCAPSDGLFEPLQYILTIVQKVPAEHLRFVREPLQVVYKFPARFL
jgi:hypothetical protein